MGIENAGGTVSFTVAGRNSASWSATNEGILFSQNNTAVVLWSPASGLSNTAILNTQATPASRTEYTITVDDGNGCVLSDALFVDPSCPLPIELINFSGFCTDNKMKFNWVTASELDNDFFTIERLDEDNVNWKSIATVKGAGTSAGMLTYSTELYNIEEGIFHLKQTDFNGGFDFSKNIKIKCNSEFIINGYPNPTNKNYTISIGSEDFKSTYVSISNSFGQIEITSMMEASNKTIDVSSLKPGIYNVTVRSKYYFKVLKLIIQ